MRPIVWTLFALAGCLMLMRAAVLAAVAPALKCEAAKLKAAGKDATCRASVSAKIALGVTADASQCDAKLAAVFTKVEARGGCATSGDAPGVAARIDESIVATTGVLNPGGPLVDNGDGTVLDFSTGLQWEKKDGSLGVQDPSDPHNVGNIYGWSTLSNTDTAPDGPVFTDFLAKLNRSTAVLNSSLSMLSESIPRASVSLAAGVKIFGCFAGHCDWRVPNILELVTLIDLQAPMCGSGGPCINPIFGPTAASVYVSSTTDAGFADAVSIWIVDFLRPVNFDGSVISFFAKADAAYVRAVRTMSGIERTTSCVPITCAALGFNCGSTPDNCGNTIACGSCSAPQTCGGAGVPNQCGTSTTTTTTSSTTSTTLCPTGLTDCSGTCVNLMTDNNNCGSCGSVCLQSCIGGVCTIP